MQSELNFVATFWLKNFIFTLILLDIQWDNIKTVSSCLNFLFTSFFLEHFKNTITKTKWNSGGTYVYGIGFYQNESYCQYLSASAFFHIFGLLTVDIFCIIVYSGQLLLLLIIISNG